MLRGVNEFMTPKTIDGRRLALIAEIPSAVQQVFEATPPRNLATKPAASGRDKGRFTGPGALGSVLEGPETGQGMRRASMASIEGRTIGFVGLGLMGKPMALNLHKAGARLIINNRSQDVVRDLAVLGMTPPPGYREA